MIERMRRATVGTAATPAPKGARFKSSPLTGDRNGVVVAERVKGDAGVRSQTDVDQGALGALEAVPQGGTEGADKI